jgi:hypothetical protein
LRTPVHQCHQISRGLQTSPWEFMNAIELFMRALCATDIETTSVVSNECDIMFTTFTTWLCSVLYMVTCIPIDGKVDPSKIFLPAVPLSCADGALSRGHFVRCSKHLQTRGLPLCGEWIMTWSCDSRQTHVSGVVSFRWLQHFGSHNF